MDEKCPESLRDIRTTQLHDGTPDSLAAKTLAGFLAKYFIARRDVKAIQRTQPTLGAYTPINTQWSMQDFYDHFDGKRSYGHYILDTNSMCKIIAYDIDFKKTGLVPTVELPSVYNEEITEEVWLNSFTEVNLRQTWLDRRHPARTWMKMCLREMAAKIAGLVTSFDVPVLTSYTGSKGMHVYGLIGQAEDYKETGRTPGIEAYEAAHAILESDENFKPLRGNVFYDWKDQDNPERRLFDIEIFPKQTEVSEGGYGNLLRLPYGRNLKAPMDPTFFINPDLAMSQIQPATFGQIFDALTVA